MTNIFFDLICGKIVTQKRKGVVRRISETIFKLGNENDGEIITFFQYMISISKINSNKWKMEFLEQQAIHESLLLMEALN